MEWDKKPIKFRDPVQGYISVPRVYVAGLIDTPYMQRIKGISQTGIRPVYPSATHDRFTHSLGVFRFAMMAYKNLKARILEDAEKNLENRVLSNPGEHNKLSQDAYLESLKWDLKFWKVLLAIAALLHDVGHPAFSHSFEFLYDDIFMVFPDDECPEGMDGMPPLDVVNMREKEQYFKWRKLNEKRQNNFDNLHKSSYDESRLKEKLREYFNLSELKNVCGKPHERMGAYMIFSGRVNDETLFKSVRTVIEAYLYCDRHDQPKNYAGIKFNKDKKDENKEIIEDSVNFICRMITGQMYSPPYNSEFIYNKYRESVRDCIIKILNGKVDVDSIDYTMRNAHSAGYDNHKVDYNRLCSSFSVFFDQNILNPCFSSAAVSVLDGFIIARNAEPTWLYSHHKVVYHDVLIKMLFKYSSKYLSYLDSLAHDDIQTENKDSISYIDIDEENFINMTGDVKEKLLEHLHCPYGIYMISPLIPYLGSNYIMNLSTDASFDALFKNIDIELSKDGRLDKNYNHIFSENDQNNFKSLIEEYISRKYKRSLWKSFPEYMVHIKSTAEQLGIPPEYVHKYMLELIEKHLTLKCFNIIDSSGNDEKIADSYKEQYTYVYYESSRSRKSIEDEQFKEQYDEYTYPDIVFGEEHGLFIYPDCVCKIFNPGLKKTFDNIKIDFGGGKRHRLSELSQDINYSIEKFPYIFISYNKKKVEKTKKTFDAVKADFWERFKKYCNRRMVKDAIPVCEEGLKLNGEHGFRDVVHGDITLPLKFWNIINTPEFMRLLRIKQLAMTSLIFPTINHTRFEHSIGTCHIMRQVVGHFREIFKKHGVEIQSDDADIAILAALLHDIGHGPFSHAFECVMNLSHEKWTERIINESGKLNKAIRENFGDNAPERVVACLNYKNIARTDSFENLNFSLIYSALVSGALDVDRIDYLSRDGYYTAAKFSNIDIPKIISAIKLTSIDGKYRLCFDGAYLSYLEQFIFARREMYTNIYYNTRKVMMETILQKIIQRAYLIRDKLVHSDRDLLEKLKDNRMEVKEYLLLDDYMMYDCFKRWREERKDVILSDLCESVLDENYYTSALDVSSDGTEREDLLNDIEEKLGSKFGKDTLESFAVFTANKALTIYPDSEKKEKEAKTILVSNQNGEVKDFGKIVKFNNTVIFCNYLFWSEKVLYDVLIERGKSEEEAMELVKQVKKIIESYKPRNHIEIERKYLCSYDTLALVKETLKSNKVDTFILDKPFTYKEQIDTYYDTEDRILLEQSCTLRIRRLNDSYVCTVKLPVKSESFGGNSPTARREYEMENFYEKPEDGNDVTKLFESQKKFILKRLGEAGITKDTFSKLQPILDIKNNREKGVVKKKDSAFECEVCLDNVTYSKPGQKGGKNDWQIEVELKSEYLTHVILDKFTAQLEELMKKNSRELASTGISKLERGLE